MNRIDSEETNGCEGYPGINQTLILTREEASSSQRISEKTRWHFARGTNQTTIHSFNIFMAVTELNCICGCRCMRLLVDYHLLCPQSIPLNSRKSLLLMKRFCFVRIAQLLKFQFAFFTFSSSDHLAMASFHQFCS